MFSGNDIGVTPKKDFGRIRLGVTTTYEDKAPTRESELFGFISVAF